MLDTGYLSTTIAAIAEDAGVSVDTIYKGFSGKAGLVRAIHEQALAGEGPIHAEIRSDELQRSEPDPRVILRAFGRFSTEVAPRAAPVILLIRDAAATDPEMADLLSELDEYRLQRMTHNARNLAAAGHLRADITVEHAAEICWIFSSAQLYEMLVINRGWSLERFGEFVGNSLIAALLPPEPG